jgi:Metallo-beta-lactamase superfamily
MATNHSVHALMVGMSESWWRAGIMPCLRSDVDRDKPVAYIFWLIEGPNGPIVVDTGYHPDYVAPDWAAGKQFIEPPKLLAEAGIESDEIETVIVTHFHQDHFTGFDYFPKARFVIQRAELEFWTGPRMRHKVLDSQIRSKVRPALERLKQEARIELIDGDVVLREGLRLNGLAEKDVTLLAVGDESSRLSGIQNGRLHGAIIAGIQLARATKLGFRQLIDFSKLPIEVASSGIIVRRSYLVKNPDTSLKFLKAWIEGIYLFKSDPQFSRNAIKRYVATQDPEILELIYNTYKDKLSFKPTPRLSVVKYMAGLLSRNYAGAPDFNPESFIEPRLVNDLEKSGFFEEMNRRYQK